MREKSQSLKKIERGTLMKTIQYNKTWKIQADIEKKVFFFSNTHILFSFLTMEEKILRHKKRKKDAAE